MKTFKKVLAFVLALAMVVTAVPVTEASAATGLPKAKTYYVGKSYTLNLTTPKSWKKVSTVWTKTNDKDHTITLKDKKAKSVRVKALERTIKKADTATVIAKVSYKKSGKAMKATYKCKVTVKRPAVSLSATKATVKVDESIELTAKYVPSYAEVSFEAEDSTVAVVEDLGNGKAKVTGVMPGKSTNIKAYVRNGNYTAMSITKVTVEGEALADGLSAKLTNQFMDYENTVVGGGANIRLYYGKGGKGISGKSIVVQNAENVGLGTWATAVTDANGYAFVTLTNPGVAKVNVKATVAATGETCNFVVNFAQLGYSDVFVVNKHGHAEHPATDRNGKKYKEDLKFNDIVVSENDVQGSVKGTGVTVSSNSYSDENPLSGVKFVANKEFVNSQQVSNKGTEDHKVGFDGGVPTITLPGNGGYVNATKYLNQEINFTSDEYHIYDSKVEWFELKVNPDELVWATMNFSNLSLSKYTHMEVSTWTSNVNGSQIGATTFVYGPTVQKDFGYQIPLAHQNASVWVKVELKAAGQVDTAKNKGYTIKDITGVYRDDVDGSNNVTQILKNAKITWEKTNAVMSVERDLTNAIAAKLGWATDVTLKVGETDESTGKVIARMTYKVPTYPYTGNAVITTYDKNNNVIAYFACPTSNAYVYSKTLGWYTNPVGVLDGAAAENGALGNYANYNVLTKEGWTYRISEEEATQSVGTVTQDGTLVTVNSEVAGTTVLVGTITADGVEAINEKVYTSVQWNPIPNAGPQDKTTGAIALAGQQVEVIAQLFDVNGNKVAKAGEPITFKYFADGDAKKAETIIAQGGSRLNYLENAIKNPRATVQAIDAQTSTDSQGQAKLILCASDVAVLVGLCATTTSYNVAISINGENVSMVDLYWVLNVSSFTDKTIGGTTTINADAHITKQAQPTVGEKWEYGFKTLAVREDNVTAKLPNAGCWKNVAIWDVQNLKMTLGVEPGSKGTVTLDTGKNGMALVTSTENAKTVLSSTVNGTPVAGEKVKFVLGNYKTVENVGTGEANPTKMLLDIDWESTGLTGNFVTASGSKADLAGTFDVYFKVTDSFGNANTTDWVEVTSSLSGSITSVTSGDGDTVDAADPGVSGLFVTRADKDGLVKITLGNQFENNGSMIAKLANCREIITVKVNGVAQTCQIVWVNPTAAVVNKTNTVNGNYLSYADDKKIVLAFTDVDTAAGVAQAINASTVDKSQFTVTRDGVVGNIDIASVTVSGNQITLTFRTPFTDNLKKTFTVAIAAADDGRVLTTVGGAKIAADSHVIQYTK